MISQAGSRLQLVRGELSHDTTISKMEIVQRENGGNATQRSCAEFNKVQKIVSDFDKRLRDKG